MLTVTQYADLRVLDSNPVNLVFNRMKLYINPIEPVPTMTIADIVECSSPWYNQENLIWSLAFINSLGKGQINGASFTWVTGAPEPTVTIYGAFWTDNNDELTAIDPFDVPVTLTVAGLNIPYQPVLTAVQDV